MSVVIHWPDGFDPDSTINVDIVSISTPLPLPTGASTSALQISGNNTLLSIDSKIPPLGQATMANSLPVAIASDQSALSVSVSNFPATQPISGTVAVSNFPATQAVTQSGAWTTGRTWTLSSGTDSISSVQSGIWNINNISGTISLPTGAATAALQTQPGVDIGDVTVNNAAGAAAVNIQDGGNSITVDGTVASTQSGTWNINNISGTISLPTGAATESTLSTLNTKIPSGLTVTSTRLLVDGSGVTQPISGTVTANAGSGTFAISAVSLPLPTGASTSALQTTGNSSLSSIDTKTPALGQAVMASSSPVVIASNQSTLAISAASLPLPSGASTAALQTQPGVDIGDVTINNASGAAAVNIQDGGNSITVDGTVAATQSGTWNINNISGTVSLPTGAATSALQTTGNASLSSIDSKIPALGQALSANSVPVVIASDQVFTIPTYEAANNVTLAANSTDVVIIQGSATKTIKIRKIRIGGTNTGNTNAAFTIIKRSTAASGGTSTVVTNVPYDSTFAAGTATVRAYTANPTVGTIVGNVRNRLVFLPTLASSNVSNNQTMEFGEDFVTPIVLRGTAESACVNFGGTAITGTTVIYFCIEWTET